MLLSLVGWGLSRSLCWVHKWKVSCGGDQFPVLNMLNCGLIFGCFVFLLSTGATTKWWPKLYESLNAVRYVKSELYYVSSATRRNYDITSEYVVSQMLCRSMEGIDA